MKLNSPSRVMEAYEAKLSKQNNRGHVIKGQQVVGGIDQTSN